MKDVVDPLDFIGDWSSEEDETNEAKRNADEEIVRTLQLSRGKGEPTCARPSTQGAEEPPASGSPKIGDSAKEKGKEKVDDEAMYDTRKELESLRDMATDLAGEVAFMSSGNARALKEHEAVMTSLKREMLALSNKVERMNELIITRQMAPSSSSDPAEMKTLLKTLIESQTEAIRTMIPSNDNVQAAVDQALLGLMADGFCSHRDMKSPAFVKKYAHLKKPIEHIIDWFNHHRNTSYPYKWIKIDGEYVQINPYQPGMTQDTVEKPTESVGSKRAAPDKHSTGGAPPDKKRRPAP